MIEHKYYIPINPDGLISNIPEDLPRTSGGFHLFRFPTDEPNTEDFMRAIELSGALDFWDDPSENIYNQTDGDPV